MLLKLDARVVDGVLTVVLRKYSPTVQSQWFEAIVLSPFQGLNKPDFRPTHHIIDNSVGFR